MAHGLRSLVKSALIGQRGGQLTISKDNNCDDLKPVKFIQIPKFIIILGRNTHLTGRFRRMLENHFTLKTIKGKASSIYPHFPYDCPLGQPDKEGFFLIEQRSPTFSARGTTFVEDNFSTDGGGERWIRW